MLLGGLNYSNESYILSPCVCTILEFTLCYFRENVYFEILAISYAELKRKLKYYLETISLSPRIPYCFLAISKQLCYVVVDQQSV